MKQQKVNYGVPQEILYSVCLAAWNLCSQYLDQFTALKAYYTGAFVTDALQAVQDAKQLPESRQTVAYRKEARINLANATRQVQDNWQLLKVYITKAFDADMVKTKLEAAGSALYAKASVDNWSAVRSLIDTANTFISGNLDALTANNNMPAAFQPSFSEDGTACIELSVIYARVTMEKQMATSVKVDANNVIYASAIEMLKDGQQIFKDDAATKKQFTFSYLVSLYQGEGSASLKGYIVNNLNVPIEGVTIVSLDGKYTATTNSKGYYRITRIAEGTYTFNVTCTGYNPLVQIISFAAGTASKGDFEMANQMKKVA
ncbi:MAG: carboxypeptidase regulatory-like domain-containing protein [Ginsengibacter sp.]